MFFLSSLKITYGITIALQNVCIDWNCFSSEQTGVKHHSSLHELKKNLVSCYQFCYFKSDLLFQILKNRYYDFLKTIINFAKTNRIR